MHKIPQSDDAEMLSSLGKRGRFGTTFARVLGRHRVSEDMPFLEEVGAELEQAFFDESGTRRSRYETGRRLRAVARGFVKRMRGGNATPSLQETLEFFDRLASEFEFAHIPRENGVGGYVIGAAAWCTAHGLHPDPDLVVELAYAGIRRLRESYSKTDVRNALDGMTRDGVPLEKYISPELVGKFAAARSRHH
jgi:hypothetical protein